MSQKRIILSDSSLNRYGYRVLTSGMLLEAFKKNPVMLYMHFRDEGSPIWGETKAIGHWEDIQLEGDVLSAIPVFDKVDQLSKDIAAKYEAGTYNAASVGIRIIATSANKDLLVPGQTRETVTESELMEAPSWTYRQIPMPFASMIVPHPFFWQRVWTRIPCQHYQQLHSKTK